MTPDSAKPEVETMPSPSIFTQSCSWAVKGPFEREKGNIMGRKELGREKASFVRYELFIQSSHELTISN